MSSSPVNCLQLAIALLRASVIISVTIRESIPFGSPCLLMKPKQILMFGNLASSACWGVGRGGAPSYQYIRSKFNPVYSSAAFHDLSVNAK